MKECRRVEERWGLADFTGGKWGAVILAIHLWAFLAMGIFVSDTSMG
jgi:hypothetical protein